MVHDGKVYAWAFFSPFFWYWILFVFYISGTHSSLLQSQSWIPRATLMRWLDNRIDHLPAIPVVAIYRQRWMSWAGIMRYIEKHHLCLGRPPNSSIGSIPFESRPAGSYTGPFDFSWSKAYSRSYHGLRNALRIVQYQTGLENNKYLAINLTVGLEPRHIEVSHDAQKHSYELSMIRTRSIQQGNLEINPNTNRVSPYCITHAPDLQRWW